ncbi:Carnitine O-acetyltransferase, mitochondrial [Neolecta irregularis DAH-3]|uniref:Carnitine O-acetyltransferase, mitochondrial n=1 Tax=Neolecta irregularis (strain DAH-3) TaxID=1198029 RepID=A0A1U7LLH0_NEOID|nr:Carnitine O-acetyltransferase, mitochondrial [Neolecta irregularis DAH-3]|eukprot:OLL23497.1 Carnitine O-acetyltransferase, mitochondrial [Neolecta irregularis DAH-3]
MLRFEAALPALPVPPLAESAAKYLQTVHPLLSPSEFAHTEAAVRSFVTPGGPGEQLQKRLQERSRDPKVSNWLAEWWDLNAYMAYRHPVVVFVSYFYAHKDDRRRRDQVDRAAAITTAALCFKKMVDEKSLEPEHMRGVPLSMESYKWMFNACRLPRATSDYSEIYDKSANKHIIVVRKNRFFAVQHDIDGKQLSTEELKSQFRNIMQAAGENQGPAIGALTSDNPSPDNKALLEKIQSASFLVCLDETAPVTLEERGRECWHGDGQNRFYDKPLQFIIFENGVSGFLGEHSMMDGTPTHRLNDYVCDVLFNNKVDHGSINRSLPPPKELKFTVTPQVSASIDQAKQNFKTLISEQDLRVQQYQGYGKAFIKKAKCSPDAYVQMIIQLAYYKMYGVSRPTYESAATRRFKLGRTETCRTVSDESVAFCKAMCDPNVSTKESIDLCRKAINAHVKYISDASEGKGVDRHLFGLKQLLKPDEPIPEIFSDPAYSYSSHWFLSTSQLSSEHFIGYGWGEVVADGYGIAYMINEDSINFNIVSKHLDNHRMQFYLKDAADELRVMFQSEMLKKAKFVSADIFYDQPPLSIFLPHNMSFTLREATVDDLVVIYNFIHDLAHYHDNARLEITKEQLREDLFTDNLAHVVLAEDEDGAIGFCLWHYAYSTWTGRVLHLEDLFVAPEKRGKGVGKAIFGYIGHIAKDHNCARVEFQVVDWNTKSIKFYEEVIGAKLHGEWKKMRIEGEELSSLYRFWKSTSSTLVNGSTPSIGNKE